MDEAVTATAAGPTCSLCGQSMPGGSRFCENCGTELPVPAPAGPSAPVQPGSAPKPATPAPAGPSAPEGDGVEAWDTGDGAAGTTAPAQLPSACSSCGGRIAPDGYCDQCGKPARTDRDHWVEQPGSWVAGVCDRGLRHAKNEDAMSVGAVGVLDYAVLVVCDGVTSAPGSEIASLAAARAAGRTLLAEAESIVRTQQSAASEDTAASEPNTAPDPVRTLRDLLIRAASAADRAISETVGDMTGVENPPSCTFAAAVAAGPLIVTGWVGDSRVYWLPDAGEARQLSEDDSWAQEMIRQGLDREKAESAPQAHAITRWLGPDAPDGNAQTMHLTPQEAGWLLVCSDGLWNYASAPSDMAAVFRSAVEQTGGDPGALAENLIAWANECGGRDNITAVVARRSAPVSSASVDH